MNVTLILTVSVAMQYLAAAMTLRIARVSTARIGWIAISVAIGLMAARRTIILVGAFDGSIAPHVAAETVGLLISTLMVIGVAKIGPLFSAVAKSEQALRAERNRAQNYLDVAGVMIVALDRDGRVTVANRKACEILGIDKVALIGTDWYATCLPHQTRSEARKRFDTIIAESHTQADYYEDKIQTRNGEIRLIAWHDVLLVDSDGTVTGTLRSGQDVTERNLAVEALRESESRYELAIAGTTDGVWDWNLETRDVKFSPSFAHLLGYEVAELENDPEFWSKALHPDDHDRIQEALDAHLKQHRNYDVEYRLKNKSGEYRWFHSRGGSVWDAGGRPTRMVGAIQDITEQKRAELSTRESEERFRQLAENISEVFWLTDWKNKELLYVSPNYEAVFGRSVESLRSNRRSWLDALCPEDRERVGTAFKIAAEAGVFVEEEYRIDRPDGTQRWIRDRAYPLRNAEEEVYRVVGVAEDVTDRRIAMRELHEANARMQTVFTNIADCLILIDSNGIVESFNRSSEKLFGYSADEIVGENVNRLMPEPFHSQHDTYLADYFQTGARKVIGMRREVTGRKKDGSTFPAELHVSEINLGDRRIFCGVVTDITFRTEAEELITKHTAELAHVARLSTMGEIAAGLAHEVSQPLTAIVNYTSGSYRQLRDGAPVTPELIDALDRASTQARRAGEIIHRLYDFAQKRKPRKDNVLIPELIGDVVRLLAAELKRGNVTIEPDFDVDLATVVGDSVQIQQVVINLMMNGIEAMTETPPENKRLSITAENAGPNQVRVSIADRGHGLNHHQQNNIFDQFYTTKTDGLGMGLSISRSIIEVHGGLLTAENNQDGGATFQFTLPCVGGKETV